MSEDLTCSATAMPLVTIVIPSYNHAAYIRRCIDSVIAQDYSNIELIIIDDGSKDHSVSIIESLVMACRERFVRFEFRSRPNKGHSATLNEALQWSQGNYFSYIGSDDVIYPNKIQKLLNVFREEPGIAVIFSGADIIDANDKVTGLKKTATALCDFEDVFVFDRHHFVAPSALIEMKALNAVSGFSENTILEDWELWLKMTHCGFKLKVIPDVLVKYRHHGQNVSAQSNTMFRERLRIVEKYKANRKYNRVVSMVYASAAQGSLSGSRCATLSLLSSSVSYDVKIIFSQNFIQSLARTLVPKSLLDAAKKVIKFRLV